jgi:SAM-dependent methyltransferase
MNGVSVIIPSQDSRGTIGEVIRRVRSLPSVGQVVVADAGSRDGTADEVERLSRAGSCELVRLPRLGRGSAVRSALSLARGEVAVILDSALEYEPRDIPALTSPILDGRADLVLGSRFLGGKRPVSGFWDALGSRTLATLAGAAVDLNLTDLGTGAKAFRTSAARGLELRAEGFGIDAELVAKFARMRYRILEVPVRFWPRHAGAALREKAELLLAAIRYSHTDDAENEHGGYRTLQVMDQAPHYAAWLASLLRPHLGQRVLEVGAGIGTITRHMVDRELVVPLDLEPRYVQQLENAFRGCANVRPLCADVAALDVDALRKERFDTVILSNVLEHIADDGAALRRFREILVPGGRLLLVVPALQAIYGSMDREVGHHRRYGRRGLTRLLVDSGYRVDRLRAMNPLGVAGWVLNGQLLRRTEVPELQLRLYDRIAPVLAALERRWEPPVGLSFFSVAIVLEEG